MSKWKKSIQRGEKGFICRERYNLIEIEYRDNNAIFWSELNITEGYYKEVDGLIINAWMDVFIVIMHYISYNIKNITK